MKQLSLLPEPSPPEGLRLLPDFLSLDEERALLQAISGLAWEEVQMHGVVAKRRVKHFGLSYGYESWDLTPVEPAPGFLQPLLARAASELGVPAAKLEEILVTEYPAGAGIGWHRDAPMFGDAVLGVSLGSDCTMKFRRRHGKGYEIHDADLVARAAYVISGPARREWQHHIAPVKKARWSITFRTVKEQRATPSSA